MKKWFRNLRRLFKDWEGDMASLNHRIDCIQRCLEDARIDNFIWIRTYRRGERVDCSNPPPPIRLEDLQRRIEELEKQLGSSPQGEAQHE